MRTLSTLSKKQKATVAGLTLLGLTGTGSLAYAYWTQGGSGVGTADAGSTAAITVNQTSAITGLYPGGAPVTLSGNFDNPNAGSVYVTSVTATLSSVSNGASNAALPACTAADFALGGSAPVNAEIASGNGVGSWSGLTVRLTNTAANQDNCKNATVNISYTAS